MERDKRADKPSYGIIAKGAKCRRCGHRASVHLPSHHANFCENCFLHFFHNAVKRAFKFFSPLGSSSIMVAVSGGKDSLALWSVMSELGYQTKGVHIDLGIEEFSDASREVSENFADKNSLPLRVYRLQDIIGCNLERIGKKTRRPVCSICGSLKRHLLNRIALKEGLTVVATGHNLDDESSRLLGNILRHKKQYLEKTYPYLPPMEKVMPARIKPLFRLESDEIKIYCHIKNINYFAGKCPFSKGATNHVYLEALQFLEGKMVGTKRDFLFGYLKDLKHPPVVEGLSSKCSLCGSPSYQEICTICKLKIETGEMDPGREPFE